MHAHSVYSFKRVCCLHYTWSQLCGCSVYCTLSPDGGVNGPVACHGLYTVKPETSVEFVCLKVGECQGIVSIVYIGGC